METKITAAEFIAEAKRRILAKGAHVSNGSYFDQEIDSAYVFSAESLKGLMGHPKYEAQWTKFGVRWMSLA